MNFEVHDVVKMPRFPEEIHLYVVTLESYWWTQPTLRTIGFLLGSRDPRTQVFLFITCV